MLSRLSFVLNFLNNKIVAKHYFGYTNTKEYKVTKGQVHKEIFLSIVIPAYNEEWRIIDTLDEFIKYLSKQSYTYEIIIVDNGSRDNTWNLLTDYSARYDFISVFKNLRNMGKGYSVKRGIEESNGKYVLFSDADMSVKPEYIQKLLNELTEGTDMVIGSRSIKGASIETPQPWLRSKLGPLFHTIVRRFIIGDFLDFICGFKGFKANAAKTICKEQTLYGYCFDVEILLIAQKNGYLIKEIPVVWNDKMGSKLSILDSPAILWEIAKIKINQIKGRYNKIMPNRK